MRFFVTYKDYKRVLGLRESDSAISVSELKRQIEVLMSKVNEDDVSIHALEVHSFPLDNDADVTQVLRDGDNVHCVDEIDYVNSTYNKSSGLHSFSRPDYVDDTTKSIELCKHNTEGTFLTWKIDKKRVLHFVTKAMIRSNGSVPLNISVVNDKVRLEVQWWMEENNLKGLSFIIQTASDKGPAKQNLPVSIEDGEITVGEASEVIEEISASSSIDPSSYPLPSSERTGPIIDLDQEIPVANPPIIVGDSVIQITQAGDIGCNQSWADSDGNFTNFFFVNLQAVNTDLEHDMSIVNVQGFYEIEGNWVSGEVSLGCHYGRGRYDWYNEKVLKLEKASSTHFAVRIPVKCKGTPGSDYCRRARAHQSLPQPMKLKINFEDVTKKTIEVVVEHVNQKIDFIYDKAYYEKSMDCTLDAYVFCDDTEALSRVFMMFYRKEKNLCIRHAGYSGDGVTYTYEYGAEDLRKLVFQATRENTTELSVDDLDAWSTSEEKGIKVTALVDLSQGFLYAFKVFVKTATGTTTEWLHVPNLN